MPILICVSFTITNPDGSTSVQPKDLASEKLYRQGINNGRNAVIAQMTGPDGKPKSELHKTALISIGVVFDQNGVARLPTTSGAPPAETPAPAAAPAAASVAPAPAPAKPAAPPQKLPTAAEFDAKWRTLKSGQSMLGPDGQTHTKR